MLTRQIFSKLSNFPQIAQKTFSQNHNWTSQMVTNNYSKGNHFQRKDTRDILQDYQSAFHWDANQYIHDIGCGPGDVTHDILLPFVKKHTQGDQKWPF